MASSFETNDLRATKQAITAQYGQALAGYNAVHNILSWERPTSSRLWTVLKNVVPTMVERALTDEKLAFMNAEHKRQGEFPFTLNLRSNNKVTKPELRMVVNRLGSVAGAGAFFWENSWDAYSATELSGYEAAAQTSVGVEFIWDAGISGAVAEQRNQFTELKQRYPELTIGVPSVLSAQTYYHTQILANGSLAGVEDSDFMHRKHIFTHVDLPEFKVGQTVGVPTSYIYRDGMAFVHSQGMDSISSSQAVLL